MVGLTWNPGSEWCLWWAVWPTLSGVLQGFCLTSALMPSFLFPMQGYIHEGSCDVLYTKDCSSGQLRHIIIYPATEAQKGGKILHGHHSPFLIQYSSAPRPWSCCLHSLCYFSPRIVLSGNTPVTKKGKKISKDLFEHFAQDNFSLNLSKNLDKSCSSNCKATSKMSHFAKVTTHWTLLRKTPNAAIPWTRSGV